MVGAVEDRDELDNLTTTHHDEFGRTSKVDEHVTLCGDCPITTHSTHYGYDITDNLTSIVDAADNSTTIVRDHLGREKTVTDPDRGQRTLTWYPDGKLEVETDANGTHHWTYDSASRPKTRTDSNQIQSDKTRWFYDTDPDTHALRGSSIGRLTRVTYSTAGSAEQVQGSDSYSYDDLGRVRSTKQCVDNNCLEIGYTYDQAGRVSDIRYPHPTDPDGELVRYTYDPAGNLTSVGAFLTNIQYNAAGQVTQQTYGNGLTENFEYDPDRLWRNNQTLSAGPPATPIYRADLHPLPHRPNKNPQHQQRHQLNRHLHLRRGRPTSPAPSTRHSAKTSATATTKLAGSRSHPQAPTNTPTPNMSMPPPAPPPATSDNTTPPATSSIFTIQTAAPSTLNPQSEECQPR